MATRFTYIGDEDHARSLKSVGARELAQLRHDMRFQSLSQGRRYLELPDGTRIFTTSVNGYDLVTIRTPIFEEEKKDVEILPPPVEPVAPHFLIAATVDSVQRLMHIVLDADKIEKMSRYLDTVGIEYTANSSCLVYEVPTYTVYEYWNCVYTLDSSGITVNIPTEDTYPVIPEGKTVSITHRYGEFYYEGNKLTGLDGSYKLKFFLRTESNRQYLYTISYQKAFYSTYDSKWYTTGITVSKARVHYMFGNVVFSEIYESQVYVDDLFPAGVGIVTNIPNNRLRHVYMQDCMYDIVGDDLYFYGVYKRHDDPPFPGIEQDAYCVVAVKINTITGNFSAVSDDVRSYKYMQPLAEGNLQFGSGPDGKLYVLSDDEYIWPSGALACNDGDNVIYRENLYTPVEVESFRRQFRHRTCITYSYWQIHYPFCTGIREYSIYDTGISQVEAQQGTAKLYYAAWRSAAYIKPYVDIEIVISWSEHNGKHRVPTAACSTVGYWDGESTCQSDGAISDPPDSPEAMLFPVPADWTTTDLENDGCTHSINHSRNDRLCTYVDKYNGLLNGYILPGESYPLQYITVSDPLAAPIVFKVVDNSINAGFAVLRPPTSAMLADPTLDTEVKMFNALRQKYIFSSHDDRYIEGEGIVQYFNQKTNIDDTNPDFMLCRNGLLVDKAKIVVAITQLFNASSVTVTGFCMY